MIDLYSTPQQMMFSLRGGVTYEYVDLGLPSHLKWAKCNVGAEKETDAGLYFAWGETTGYTASQVGNDKQFSSSDYKYGNSSSNLTKYNQSDGKTVLESTDDAATQIMGGDWRMPTKAEFDELLSGTTSEWTTINGVSGRRFTSKINGNSIFIPAAGWCYNGAVGTIGDEGPEGTAGYDGCIWSSSLYTYSSFSAWFLDFSEYDYRGTYINRYFGLSVRGVRK